MRNRQAETMAANLEKAVASGHYMTAIWWLNGDQIMCELVTEAFPTADYEACQELLGNLLDNDKKKVEEETKPK